MSASSRTKVLIVEDEPLIAILAEDMIQELGYEVVGTAHSVLEALSALLEHRPEIALLDIKLRSETSLPIAELCRQLGIRVAFTTGYSARDIPEECGDAPVLAKPYSLVELQEALERAAPAVLPLHRGQGANLVSGN
jgi:CheY-like chemotaxis protein